MASLKNHVIVTLGTTFASCVANSWLGLGTAANGLHTLADLGLETWQKKKAQRDLEDLGERVAEELLPLFEREVQANQLNAVAVVDQLAEVLKEASSAKDLLAKNLDTRLIVESLDRRFPLPPAQFSAAEESLYRRALVLSVRRLVQIASELPNFQERFAERSLHQLEKLVGTLGEVLARVRQLEEAVINSPETATREFEINYRQAILNTLDYVELFGIDLPLELQRPKLSVAWVSLSVEKEGKGSNWPLTELLDHLPELGGRILIRGEAGMGKSTLLRWAALQAAAARTGDGLQSQFGIDSPWLQRIPFLILLRHCEGGKLPAPEDLPRKIASALGAPPQHWVQQVLEQGRGLLLIDGIDEVPKFHREETKKEIAALLGRFPNNLFLVTTRPKAAPENWLRQYKFEEARINLLSDSDRSLFIQRWHGATAEMLKELGRDSNALPSLAAALEEKLTDLPALGLLARNPLLCALICALHRDRHQYLPKTQRDICEALCQALLDRRDQESGLPTTEEPELYRNLDYKRKRLLVQELAQYMVQEGISTLAVATAEAKLAKVLSALATGERTAAAGVKLLLERLVERSGILREDRPGELSFIHNTFKELLAADYFVEEGHVRLLADHFLDPEWQPVIIFAAATTTRDFAPRLIREIAYGRKTEQIWTALTPMSKKWKVTRARQVMAVRCGAVACWLGDLEPKLEEFRATLLPPRNKEDAEILASCGELIVDSLGWAETISTEAAVASIETLGLIGSKKARVVLWEYRHDQRLEVAKELAQYFEPLTIPSVRNSVQSWAIFDFAIQQRIKDLKPLLTHPSLTKLNLCLCSNIEDYSPLRQLPEVTELNLAFSNVTDLSTLASMSKLERLDLSDTQVRDLTPLRQLPEITELNLAQCNLRDLSALAAMRRLKRLDISNTQVRDLSALMEIPSLKILDLDFCRTDAEPSRALANLVNLTNLSALRIGFSSLEFLNHLSHLKNLRIDWIPTRGAKDFSILQALDQRGVKLDFFVWGSDHKNRAIAFSSTASWHHMPIGLNTTRSKTAKLFSRAFFNSPSSPTAPSTRAARSTSDHTAHPLPPRDRRG